MIYIYIYIYIYIHRQEEESLSWTTQVLVCLLPVKQYWIEHKTCFIPEASGVWGKENKRAPFRKPLPFLTQILSHSLLPLHSIFLFTFSSWREFIASVRSYELLREQATLCCWVWGKFVGVGSRVRRGEKPVGIEGRWTWKLGNSESR
jgi:hypothetical protein